MCHNIKEKKNARIYWSFIKTSLEDKLTLLLIFVIENEGLHETKFCIQSYQRESYRSCCIGSCGILLFHSRKVSSLNCIVAHVSRYVSYRIVLCRIVSSHIISCHIISFHNKKSIFPELYHSRLAELNP